MKQLSKAVFVAALIAICSGLGFEAAIAATGTEADPAVQFLTRIGLGVGMGALISTAKVFESGAAPDRRKLSYSMIIAVFSAFMVIDAFKEPVTYENAIGLMLQIAGGAFFTNAGIATAARLKASAKANSKTPGN